MAGTPRDIPYLESKFETDDIPVQQDFYDLFASFLHYQKITQSTGTDTDKVMSQKAVSDALVASADYKLSTVDTTASVMALDFAERVNNNFTGSNVIGADKEIQLQNDSNAVHFDFLFTLTAAINITMPANFKIAPASYDSATHIWSSLAAGTYVMEGRFDGTNWWVTINNWN